MIPLDDTTEVIRTGPLDRLAALLRDGSLRRAEEQKKLGTSLRQTQHRLTEDELQTKLSVLLPALKVSASHLQHRSAVEEALRKLYGLSKGLQEAQTREGLDKLRMSFQTAISDQKLVEREAKAAWLAWVETSFGDIQRLAELLGHFDGTREVGQQLKSGASEGLRLKTGFPPTQEQVDRAIALVEQQHGLLEGLRQKEELQDLLAFLDRVLVGDATLEHITPKLLDWLRVNNALRLLRIRL